MNNVFGIVLQGVMERQTYFHGGETTFELADISDVCSNRYMLVERGRRPTTRIKVVEDNLRWLCDAFKHVQ